MRLDHEDVGEVLGTMSPSTCSRRPAWSRGGLILSASAAAAQQTTIPLIHPSHDPCVGHARDLAYVVIFGLRSSTSQ